MDTVRQFTVIHLGTDHAGYALKESVLTWLRSEDFMVHDHGAFVLDSEDDYPDFITPAARAVAESGDARTAAIIFGGSGEGEAMAANRIKGVRATVYYGGDETIIRLSREHNHANVLSLGARFLNEDHAKKIIWDWLHTAPETSARHERRIAKLDGAAF